MDDPRTQQSIQWLQWYNRQYGAPQKDPSVVPRLTRAVADYLDWMTSVNYTAASRQLHRRQLKLFLSFVKNRRFDWQQLFTEKTRAHFKKLSGLHTTAALNGLCRYLAEQGQIRMPLARHRPPRKLAGIFEDYVHYCRQSRHTSLRQSNSIRRVLSALCEYLNKNEHRRKPASHRSARCLYGGVLPALFADDLPQLPLYCARLFALPASAAAS